MLPTNVIKTRFILYSTLFINFLVPLKCSKHVYRGWTLHIVRPEDESVWQVLRLEESHIGLISLLRFLKFNSRTEFSLTEKKRRKNKTIIHGQKVLVPVSSLFHFFFLFFPF